MDSSSNSSSENMIESRASNMRARHPRFGMFAAATLIIQALLPDPAAVEELLLLLELLLCAAGCNCSHKWQAAAWHLLRL